MGPLSDSSRRAVAYWLLACCALVFAMVVVGGMTRLTHSGLSIVEWRPVTGTLPPLNEAQWQAEFGKYQSSPEFRQRNHAMTLEGFKGIYWWEYFHRLLGRLIGLAFALPFLWFLARGAVRGALAWKLAGIFLLGGLQGAVGWYMVRSGLDHDPMVSPVRLAMHLGLAFVIYAAMFWVALGLLRPGGGAPCAGPRRLAAVLPYLVFGMVVTGAFVAGIRAGYAYNTWPLMNGHLVPPEIWVIEPWWRNFAFNMAMVQFNHRTLGLLLVGGAAAAWVLQRRAGGDAAARAWAHALLAVVLVQFALGITTLLARAALPLAAIHQAFAVIVFTCALGYAHAMRRPRLQA